MKDSTDVSGSASYVLPRLSYVLESHSYGVGEPSPHVGGCSEHVGDAPPAVGAHWQAVGTTFQAVGIVWQYVGIGSEYERTTFTSISYEIRGVAEAGEGITKPGRVKRIPSPSSSALPHPSLLPLGEGEWPTALEEWEVPVRRTRPSGPATPEPGRAVAVRGLVSPFRDRGLAQQGPTRFRG